MNLIPEYLDIAFALKLQLTPFRARVLFASCVAVV